MTEIIRHEDTASPHGKEGSVLRQNQSSFNPGHSLVAPCSQLHIPPPPLTPGSPHTATTYPDHQSKKGALHITSAPPRALVEVCGAAESWLTSCRSFIHIVAATLTVASPHTHTHTRARTHAHTHTQQLFHLIAFFLGSEGPHMSAIICPSNAGLAHCWSRSAPPACNLPHNAAVAAAAAAAVAVAQHRVHRCLFPSSDDNHLFVVKV